VIDAERRPTIYRDSDGSSMTWGDAMRAWAPVAADELRAAAASGSRLAPGDLVSVVQARSGVFTSHPHAEWLPRLLAKVDATAGEPLSGFCAGAAGKRPTRGAASERTRSASRTPARATTRAPRTSREEPAPAFCPHCFTQLPATGICDCR
jgi:hypothetical protein